MDKRIRLAAVSAAIVVLAGAAFLIPRGDDSSTPPTASSAIEATSATGATTVTRSTETRKPKPPLLTAANPKEIEVELGQTVVFAAESDTADEVHVHGYDKSMDLPADKRKTMRFKADIEGIFEIELEQSGQPIGTLTVSAK